MQPSMLLCRTCSGPRSGLFRGLSCAAIPDSASNENGWEAAELAPPEPLLGCSS